MTGKQRFGLAVVAAVAAYVLLELFIPFPGPPGRSLSEEEVRAELRAAVWRTRVWFGLAAATTLFVLWVLWRAMRAHERLAGAAEAWVRAARPTDPPAPRL